MTGVGFEPTTYGLKALHLPGLTWYQTTLSTEDVPGAHTPKGTRLYVVVHTCTGFRGTMRGTLSQIMPSLPKGPI